MVSFVQRQEASFIPDQLLSELEDTLLTEDTWNSTETMEAVEAAFGRNASEYFSHMNWSFVNRTVIPYLLNRTLEVDQVPHFVKVIRDTHTTVVDVRIASPNTIVSVYLLIFVPVAMAWAAMRHYGTLDKHYLIILPITLCTTYIGLDLVNQSLSVLMNSPNALTAIQALSMVIASGMWTVGSEIREPKMSMRMVRPLTRWSIVAILYAVYQVLNHLVFYYCSLSERTVFMNLCPIVALCLESALLPAKAQKQVSYFGKMALFGMTFGAVLFALQYPNFSTTGVISALSMIVVIIPYRLMQRWLLVECCELPVAVLCCYDGLFLLAPSSLLTALSQDQFWSLLSTWFSDPSIVLMLVLSWASFIGNHVFVLLLLRETSATSAIVINNVSNFVVVLEGVLFFGDRVMENPLVLIGILISLCSGVWYSVEMFRAQPTQPELTLQTEADKAGCSKECADKAVGDYTLSGRHLDQVESQATSPLKATSP